MNRAEQDSMQQRIAELEQKLADLHARMPAHSMSAAMAMELEALEEAIEDLRKQAQRKDQDT